MIDENNDRRMVWSLQHEPMNHGFRIIGGETTASRQILLQQPATSRYGPLLLTTQQLCERMKRIMASLPPIRSLEVDLRQQRRSGKLTINETDRTELEKVCGSLYGLERLSILMDPANRHETNSVTDEEETTPSSALSRLFVSSLPSTKLRWLTIIIQQKYSDGNQNKRKLPTTLLKLLGRLTAVSILEFEGIQWESHSCSAAGSSICKMTQLKRLKLAQCSFPAYISWLKLVDAMQPAVLPLTCDLTLTTVTDTSVPDNFQDLSEPHKIFYTILKRHGSRQFYINPRCCFERAANEHLAHYRALQSSEGWYTLTNHPERASVRTWVEVMASDPVRRKVGCLDQLLHMNPVGFASAALKVENV